ncbi:uncharacterized protein MONOS_16189 [Monocercomonoides exilis]|uniref:uncharacterized protein n=1 Tax=Monocercomonoides exilis TaxID=2049356 RepID=UPI003559D5E8|nr:hypothetical protein MONOS_16189 [Monocercomonoides exilis]|eukprot:MONOS_16189.1-p1 / transcript=MONOS_16189.1 / gene=MONOS_16189 / organism=Monocercomonoides_exilis_PA203 / gene_product=unspecified product / transcript_product=unspecified product / location=Mono_scaffold01554:2796-3104(+) / protein_length=103 / sequence_SO=supercontig / SO=protein_coding / is_pseudo=false
MFPIQCCALVYSFGSAVFTSSSLAASVVKLVGKQIFSAASDVNSLPSANDQLDPLQLPFFDCEACVAIAAPEECDGEAEKRNDGVRAVACEAGGIGEKSFEV